MTKKEFQELTEKVLILDGATGSNLMAQGMPRGICTEQWVMEHKEIIQNLQSAYIEAGSQVIYALHLEVIAEIFSSMVWRNVLRR